MLNHCWSCGGTHAYGMCPNDLAKKLKQTKQAAAEHIDSISSQAAWARSNLTQQVSDRDQIIQDLQRKLRDLQAIAAPLIEAEERKKRAEAEEKERQRLAEIRRKKDEHQRWLRGLNNQTAKSVFIFNPVEIGIHNYRHDATESFDVQAGTYSHPCFSKGGITITDDYRFIMPDGRSFKRSGYQVYGSDGSYFQDHPPAHISLPTFPDMDEEYSQIYHNVQAEIEKEKRLRKNRKIIIAASLLVSGLAITTAAYHFRDTIFEPIIPLSFKTKGESSTLKKQSLQSPSIYTPTLSDKELREMREREWRDTLPLRLVANEIHLRLKETDIKKFGLPKIYSTGIRVERTKEGLEIISLMQGGSALAHGLRTGDIITYINDTSTASQPMHVLMEKITDDKPSVVNLTVSKAVSGKMKTFEIPRTAVNDKMFNEVYRDPNYFLVDNSNLVKMFTTQNLQGEVSNAVSKGSCVIAPVLEDPFKHDFFIQVTARTQNGATASGYIDKAFLKKDNQRFNSGNCIATIQAEELKDKITRLEADSQIGAKLFKVDGQIMISALKKNGPAMNAGLNVGDRITHIDDERILNITGVDAAIAIAGNGKTSVRVNVTRENDGSKIALKLEKSLISPADDYIRTSEVDAKVRQAASQIQAQSVNSAPASVAVQAPASAQRLLIETAAPAPNLSATYNYYRTTPLGLNVRDENNKVIVVLGQGSCLAVHKQESTLNGRIKASIDFGKGAFTGYVAPARITLTSSQQSAPCLAIAGP